MDLALGDQPVETAADAAAAALFAGALAFAGSAVVGANAAAVACAAFAGAFALLRTVSPGEATHPLPAFDPVDAPAEVHELLLSEEMIFEAAGERTDVLVLDDVLARIGPDSRVVRLFDPDRMPTPGELKATIDRHLRGTDQGVPDASQALSDALAQLRRSLR